MRSPLPCATQWRSRLFGSYLFRKVAHVCCPQGLNPKKPASGPVLGCDLQTRRWGQATKPRETTREYYRNYSVITVDYRVPLCWWYTLLRYARANRISPLHSRNTLHQTDKSLVICYCIVVEWDGYDNDNHVSQFMLSRLIRAIVYLGIYTTVGMLAGPTHRNVSGMSLPGHKHSIPLASHQIPYRVCSLAVALMARQWLFPALWLLDRATWRPRKRISSTVVTITDHIPSNNPGGPMSSRPSAHGMVRVTICSRSSHCRAAYATGNGSAR